MLLEVRAKLGRSHKNRVINRINFVSLWKAHTFRPTKTVNTWRYLFAKFPGDIKSFPSRIWYLVKIYPVPVFYIYFIMWCSSRSLAYILDYLFWTNATVPVFRTIDERHHYIGCIQQYRTHNQNRKSFKIFITGVPSYIDCIQQYRPHNQNHIDFILYRPGFYVKINIFKSSIKVSKQNYIRVPSTNICWNLRMILFKFRIISISLFFIDKVTGSSDSQ